MMPNCATAQLGLASGQGVPVAAGGFQELERAGDVGADEVAGAVDRAVDVAFGGEVHDRVHLVPAQEVGHQRPVADVALDEGVAGDES